MSSTPLKVEGLGLGHKIASILLGTTLLALVITGSLFFFKSQQALEKVIINHLNSVAFQQSNLVNQILMKHKDRIALVTSRTQLRLSLSKWISEKEKGIVPDAAHVALMKRILVDAQGSIDDIDGIAVYDLQGQQVTTTSAKLPASVTIEPQNEGVTDVQSSIIVSVMTDDKGRHALLFKQPLFLDGKSIGFAQARVGLSDLTDLAQTYTGLGHTEETLLIAQQGDLRISLLPLKFHKSIDDKPALDPFHMVNNPSGDVNIFRDYRGEEVFAIARVFPDIKWGMVFKIDVDDALAAIETQRDFLLLALLLATVATLAVAMVFSQSITKPIVDLTYVATMIASGDLSKRIQHIPKDELGLLAAAFNRMADRLIQANQLLEDRVRAKTKELRAANASLSRLNKDLEVKILEDPLTKIANRRSFDERYASEWKRCVRYKKYLALLVVDIDFFKQYNDELGHAAGDECLKEVAHILQSVAKRDTDLVARIGGEEFALLLPDTQTDYCLAMTKQLKEALEARHIEHPASAVADHVTISVGIGILKPTPELDRTQFFESVDAALYYAKQEGRNTAKFAAASKI